MINLSSDQLENLSSDQRPGLGPGGASISRPWGMGPVPDPHPPAEPTFSETHHHQTDELVAPAEPTFSLLNFVSTFHGSTFGNCGSLISISSSPPNKEA